MNEDSFISPALTGDINERLEKRFADEADNCNIGPQVTLLRANKSKILPKFCA